MRKTEYLHLHALFVELRQQLQETEEIPSDAFTAYDEYGIRPTGVHRRKDRHHRALGHLRDGVQATIETDRTADASSQPIDPTSR